MRIEYGVEFDNQAHPYDVLVDGAKCLEFFGNGLNPRAADSLVIEISNNISTAYDGLYYPTNRIVINHFNAWRRAYERLQSPEGVNANLSSALIHEMQHAVDYNKLGLAKVQKIVQQAVFCVSLFGRYEHFGYAIDPFEVRARHTQLKYGTDPYWNSLVRLVPK